MVTHDPAAAARADTVVFLADGRIVDRLDRPDVPGWQPGSRHGRAEACGRSPCAPCVTAGPCSSAPCSSVALGVALVQSSTVLLGGRRSDARAIRCHHLRRRAQFNEAADGVSSLMGISIVLGSVPEACSSSAPRWRSPWSNAGETSPCSGSTARRAGRYVDSWSAKDSSWVSWAPALGALVGLRGDGCRGPAGAQGRSRRRGAGRRLPVVGAPGRPGRRSRLRPCSESWSRHAEPGGIRPLDALRETGQECWATTAGRWVWGLGLGVPSIVGAFLAQATGDLLVSIMVGLLVIVAGSVALQHQPLVVPLVARPLALPARRHVVSELAQAGMRDGVRRTATTAGPVIVLFGIVVGLLGILATQTEATRIERVQQSSADLVVQSDGDVSEQVRAVHGVAEVDAETDVSMPVHMPRNRGGWTAVESPTVTAVDASTYGELTHQPLVGGRMAAFEPGHAVLGPAAIEDGLGRPSEIRVGDRRLPVAARVDTTIAGGSDVLVDRSVVPAGASRTRPRPRSYDWRRGCPPPPCEPSSRTWAPCPASLLGRGRWHANRLVRTTV